MNTGLNFEELEEIVAPSAAKEFLQGFAVGVGAVAGTLAIAGAIAT